MGAILTGREIEWEIEAQRIEIVPFVKERLGANSYDVTLSSYLYMLKDQEIDVRRPAETVGMGIPEDGLVLQPGRLYLGSTVERTNSPHHVPMYEGRSTMARYGISSHLSAGFGDIGFSGAWTLEITVIYPTRIYPNMRIGQVFFLMPEGSTEIKYAGGYSGHYGAAGPRPNNI
jgi:dCTP deaminase